MFLGINMFYLYVTTRNKTSEVVIFDRNVLRVR